MKASALLPPVRFDFVVLTVNDVETSEAVSVLGLENEGKESGLNYRWGFVQRKRPSAKIPVALVSFNDKQGVAEAVNRTQDILEVLKPQYILVLGTAGGLKRKGGEVETGDVVVSYLIHYGTFKDADRTTHRGLPVIPPNGELYDQANEIDKYSGWLSEISAKRPREGRPKVVFKEIASTDLLLANLNQPILRHFEENCPRIAAVEMESGGVAMKLYSALRDERVPGYLVIKGVSDIADDRREESEGGDAPKTNQQERDEWRRYASHVSAVFARALISSFEPKRKWPTALERLRPQSLDQTIKINTNCAGVFYKVKPETYSEVTAYNLSRLSAHSDPQESLFFSLSVYDPQQLWGTIQRGYNHDYNRDPAAAVPLSKLKGWALASFPHFKMFQKFSADPEQLTRCVRIVLVDDYDDWGAGVTRDHWGLFKALNGNVPCWAVERSWLRPRSPFVSEYVIICERLVLDYYEESSVLIVTELFEDSVRRDFLWLKSKFDEARAADGTVGFPFKPIEELEQEAAARFGPKGQDAALSQTAS
jgi:nucleoside phosphorylase